MNLRKEPILFVGAIAVAGLALSGGDSANIRDSARPKEKSFEAIAKPMVVLADARDRVAAMEVFREPTEALPLPPAELPFPPLPELPIVAPPLPGGPMPDRYHLLRIPYTPPVVHAWKASAAPPDDGGEEPPAPSVAPAERQLTEEELAARFDRIWTEGAQPLWGLVMNENKLNLPQNGTPPVAVRFQFVSRTNGRPNGGVQEFEPSRVRRIQFADSLENQIAFRRKELSNASESVPKRIELLSFLLDAAKQQAWVWGEAETEGKALVAITKSEEGYSQLLRVYRAQGDFGKELALLSGLPGDLADSPFRWREQGRLEARLRMSADAEAHLRLAQQKAPTDARNTHALAAFLLEEGRPSEALPFAEHAARSTAQEASQVLQQYAITLSASRLAMGDLEGATAALDRAPGTALAVALQRGTVEYSRGNLEAATTYFQRCVDEGFGPAAQFALGATKLRQGEWDAARDLLLRVRDDSPVMRARAAAALGLLYERTGHAQDAAAELDFALRTDPSDPWIAYLRGRQHRLDGSFEAASDALRVAQARADDFREALAEAGLTWSLRGLNADGIDPDALARAVRYLDRTVALEGGRGWVGYTEILGALQSKMGDTARARAAFESIRERGSAFARIGSAILDYRQKRTQDARAVLAAMKDDGAVPLPVRDIARDLVDRIDDHMSKEQLRDGFAREELGLWTRDGALIPRLSDGVLRFIGQSGRVEQDAFVRRTLKRGGDFLSAEVNVQLGGDIATTNFAGLRISNAARAEDFVIEVGFRRFSADLVPHVRVQDGAPRGDQNRDPIQLRDLAVDMLGKQTLLVAIVPDADRSSNKVGLAIYWNGRLVHQEPALRGLNTRSTFQLATDLVVAGKQVNVGFDDYRLERRKETR
jgi:tetratricopeptide (TPR) repeat protein